MSDNLPSDVVFEILSRVPVKSLLRFTSVCKSWYSLITNPIFIATHLNRAIANTNNGSGCHNDPLLFVRHYNMFQEIERYALHFDRQMFDPYTELECPFATVNEYFRIVGVCNGLICLADDYDSHTDTIIIWNPSIRKSVTLPKPGFAFQRHGICLLGFGFDTLSHDHKVVRILYQAVNHNYKVPPKVEIYSLRSDTWKDICYAAPGYVVQNFFTIPTFLNGSLHWVAANWVDKSSFYCFIVTFDMGAEVFREMMMPESAAHTDILKLSIAVWGTSLALIQYEKIWQSDYCWLWVMKEYGKVQSWTKVLTIDMRGGIRNVVGFRKSNEVLLSARVRGLVSYDPKTQRFGCLGIHGSNRSFYADSFVESLLLLRRESDNGGPENASDAVTNQGASVLLREEDGIVEQQ